jgi:hypothetical protein
MIANGVMLDSPGRSEAEALGYRVAAMQAPKISAYLDA